jgi:hypothetical protein
MLSRVKHSTGYSSRPADLVEGNNNRRGFAVEDIQAAGMEISILISYNLPVASKLKSFDHFPSRCRFPA